MSQGFDEHHQERPTLLIADDDPVVRSMLSMVLEQRFEVVAAVGSGEEAVSAAVSLKPDAAVIDVDMPGGGGGRAVSGIAEGSPATAVVVLSGDEADTGVRELLQAGAMTYRRKGIPPQELSEALESSIEALRKDATTGSETLAER